MKRIVVYPTPDALAFVTAAIIPVDVGRRTGKAGKQESAGSLVRSVQPRLSCRLFVFLQSRPGRLVDGQQTLSR